MVILWLDSLEWYVVCEECYKKFRGSIWTSSLRDLPHPIFDLKKVLDEAKKIKQCEFCGKKIVERFKVNFSQNKPKLYAVLVKNKDGKYTLKRFGRRVKQIELHT
ncbi:MAG: hypothetical protein B6U77_00745 [Candidatus Hecatellales archaeon ex4484_218]|nr:MAG: hypothetical protein B6U77_00745 [Candidatus Hecatellales archaeon ex4484_218]